MTNKEKIQQLLRCMDCRVFYGGKCQREAEFVGCQHLISLRMFAEWKDKEFAKEKQQLIDEVAKMRRLQKEYFRKRDPYVLKKAKEAEAAVDVTIKQMNDKQIKLEL